MSDTPRTDAEMEDARNVALEFECKNPAPLKGENIYVVPADFARQLERDWNGSKEYGLKMRQELMAVSEERDKQVSITIGQMEKITQLRAEVDRLQAIDETCRNLGRELHEAKAEVERLRLKVTNPVTGSILDNVDIKRERDHWRDRCEQLILIATMVFDHLRQSNDTFACLAAWNYETEERTRIIRTQQGMNAAAIQAYERLDKEGK